MRSIPTTAALLLLSVACSSRAPAGPGPASGPAVPEPVLRHHQASGGDAWNRLDLLETTGTVSVGGLSGPITNLEDVRTGRYLTRYQLGPMSGANGFDGQVSWSQDGGGEVEVADTPEAVARARTQAWLGGRRYLQPDSARWRVLGDRTEAGRRFQVLEATPQQGAPIELWFDADTGLLARTRHREGRHLMVTRYQDYRQVAGVRVPFRMVTDRGEPRALTTIVLTAVTPRGPAGGDAFARPATAADKASFVGGVDRTELPFELINNHIYITAAVDGRPVRMLVDTGGLNLLVPASAARLGLKAEGKLAASGTGAREVDVAMARAGRLDVGAVRLTEPMFYVLDLGDLPDIEGEDFDGLVGFELFHRFVVRIDYAGRRITLQARESFTPPAGAAAVKFELSERTPVAAGSIDGIPARLTIDTGARGALTTHGPFTREQKLVDRYRPRFETITGWGVGGPARGYPVRFGEVRLGEVGVRGVVGDLFTGDKGAMADPDISANLGSGLLRRFVVTFDYGKRTMYLQPGPERDAADTYDRLGAWLSRDRDALRIRAVTPGGAAEKAGLRADDRIVAIDGAAAPSRRLADWRTRFRTDPPGTRVRLTIERAGKRREVTVTLVELVP